MKQNRCFLTLYIRTPRCAQRGEGMDNKIQLVKAAKEGDSNAFAQLYGVIYQDLYRFALYTLGNFADAEDAVSEAVIDAYASIRKLRSEEAFKAWMFRILINKCKNKRKEYTKKHLEWNEAVGGQTAKEELEENLQIREAFWSLKEEERIIVGMHVFGGYTSREIAAILKKNHNTIRTKESRALKKMAEQLQEIKNH